MAHVDWSAGIDSVSGALSKPGKSGQHSCAKMLLGTHRVAPTSSSECTRLYYRKSIKRSTPVSATELAVRNKFASVSRAVSQRLNDVEHHAADLAAFNAQKDLAGGKKTLRAYLWQVLGDVYDENQG